MKAITVNKVALKTKGIGKRLLIARQARGFNTRRKFAILCKVPPPTYFNHENERSNVSINHFICYATNLNVSINWLAVGEGHPLDSISTDKDEIRKFNAVKILGE